MITLFFLALWVNPPASTTVWVREGPCASPCVRIEQGLLECQAVCVRDLPKRQCALVWHQKEKTWRSDPMTEWEAFTTAGAINGSIEHRKLGLSVSVECPES